MGFGRNANAFTNSLLRSYALFDESARRNRLDAERLEQERSKQDYARAVAQAFDNARYRTTPYGPGEEALGQDLADPEFGLRASGAPAGNQPGFGLQRIVGEYPAPDLNRAYPAMMRAAGEYGQPDQVNQILGAYAANQQRAQAQDWTRQRAGVEDAQWNRTFQANQAERATDNRRQAQAEQRAQQEWDARQAYTQLFSLGSLLAETEQAERDNPQQFAGQSERTATQWAMQNGSAIARALGAPEGVSANLVRVGPQQYRAEIGTGEAGATPATYHLTPEMLMQMGYQGLGKVKTEEDKLVEVGDDPMTGEKRYELASRLRGQLQGGLPGMPPRKGEAEIRMEVDKEAKKRNPWGPDFLRPGAMEAAYGPGGDVDAWKKAEVQRRLADQTMPLRGSTSPAPDRPAAAPPTSAAPSSAGAKQSASAYVQAAQAAGATRDQALAAAQARIAQGLLVDDLTSKRSR